MAGQTIYNPATTEIRKGITLIEASAGTGKTFAISMLVLRAVVEKEITIDQILVVTFTVAATEELRERIRYRLRQGRDFFCGISKEDDPVLETWATGIKDRKRAEHLLSLALLDIDRAGIYTIHGFCQRMLTDQALESGQLFDTELTGDARLVKSEIIRDYWRSRLYKLNKRYCPFILSSYGEPEALYQSVRGSEELLAELIPGQNSVDHVCEDLEKILVQLKEWWLEDSGSLLESLEKADDAGFLKKKVKIVYRDYCDVLEKCLSSSLFPPKESLSWLGHESLLDGLNGTKLKGDKKLNLISGWQLPKDLISSYLNAIDALVLEIRLELAIELRNSLSQRLQARGLMSFDDLIVRLATAVSGGESTDLRRLIGQRYRMALIDEFQDTDSAQWEIFYRLFGSENHFLYLIGDPKQAIYRFRGADIFSYFNARDRANRKLTLSRNFRSHPELMNAVNDLFEGREIAGTAYVGIEPAKRVEDGQLKESGSNLSSMIYCQLSPFSDDQEQWASTSANDRIRKWVVSEISRLLDCRNKFTIETMGQGGVQLCRYLKAADIAVLVRTHYQAELYQRDLRRAGIPAVISSKTNVFHTPESNYLLSILQSISSPGDMRSLKAAMSCEWFGLMPEAFLQISNDDAMLNNWLERFHSYYEMWMVDGFLAMFGRFLTDEKVFIHLCKDSSAERRIANIQHLAELVQQAEQDNRFGVSQTVMWLNKMKSGIADIKETELRLESDNEAVKILTMHSAKGLEFPVVFCPFLMLGPRPPKEEPTVTRCHTDEGILVADIGSKHFQENKERANFEEWQEDLRLVYVAITRAVLRCYLFWGDIKKVGRYPASLSSPFASIVFPDGTTAFAEQQHTLKKRGNRFGAEYLQIDNEPDKKMECGIELDHNESFKVAVRGDRSLRTSRVLTSFSGLASTSIHTNEEVMTGAFDEKGAGPEFDKISILPGGVRFGNIVHDALEQRAFGDLATDDCKKEFLSGLCRRYNLEVDPEPLSLLLKNIVCTSLSDGDARLPDFALRNIKPQCMIKEMGFTFPMACVDTERINTILIEEMTCTPVMNRHIAGYLTGFVDLVCEYDNRYYIIDYKTNFLGNNPLSYSSQSMQSAMRAHNYGLQYWLYTLVVHRYLSRWLSNYSYELHFGGIMYLFVRGMMPHIPGSGVFRVMPAKDTLDKLDNCFAGGSK